MCSIEHSTRISLDKAVERMPPKKKVPNPKGDYIIYSNHDELPKQGPVLNFVSFDPGQKNFDIRLESRDRNAIVTRAHAKYDIPMKRSRTSIGTYSEVITYIVGLLDSYSHFLGDTHIALIEDQMNVNNGMMMVYTSIITYFVCRYPDMVVIAPSSKLKGKCLGAPDMTRHELKAWGVGKATRLALQRNDRVFLDFLDAMTAEIKRQKDSGVPAAKIKVKLDDSTDNYIQIEAFCTLVGYRTTKKVYGKKR